MASTVDQVIAKFRTRYPDCDTATAQNFFLDALKYLVMRVPVRNVVVYVPMVAGQELYDLASGVFQVHSAYIEWGVGSSYELGEKSTSEKDVLQRNWRANNPNGGPWEYYISTAAKDAGGGDVSMSSAKNVVGFYPLPATTTGATYPRVALYTTSYLPLSGSETVPENLLSDNVFIYRMFQYWAEYVGNPQLAEYWEARAEKEINLNNVHIQAIQNQGQSGIMYMGSFSPTRVR